MIRIEIMIVLMTFGQSLENIEMSGEKREGEGKAQKEREILDHPFSFLYLLLLLGLPPDHFLEILTKF